MYLHSSNRYHCQLLSLTICWPCLCLLCCFSKVPSRSICNSCDSKSEHCHPLDYIHDHIFENFLELQFCRFLCNNLAALLEVKVHKHRRHSVADSEKGTKLILKLFRRFYCITNRNDGYKDHKSQSYLRCEFHVIWIIKMFLFEMARITDEIEWQIISFYTRKRRFCY